MEAKFFKTITDLPLSKFIECLVDKNLQALVISGSPSNDDLSLAWNTILMDYNDAMGDSENKLYFQLMKDVNILLITLKLIEVDLLLLKMNYRKEDGDHLNQMLETNFDFDIEDPEEYQQLLKKCELRSGGIYLQYQLKKAEFDRIKEKGENSNFKPSREYFQSLLITLSDHAKFQIAEDSITVFMFCERVKRFGQYIKTIEKNGK